MSVLGDSADSLYAEYQCQKAYHIVDGAMSTAVTVEHRFQCH